MLYPYNPYTHTNRSYVSATEIPAEDTMIPPQGIISDNKPICGQENRTSMNFLLGGNSSGLGYWKVHVADGISFEIWEDISFGTDTKVAFDVKNGQSIPLPSSTRDHIRSLYIAKPKGTDRAFVVKFTIDTDIPPPPPPPPV